MLVIPRCFNQEESTQYVNQIRDVVSQPMFFRPTESLRKCSNILDSVKVPPIPRRASLNQETENTRYHLTTAYRSTLGAHPEA